MKGIFEIDFFIPNGLLDPVEWRNIKWVIITIKIINGNKKCSLKNRIKVEVSTDRLPHNQMVIFVPIKGIAVIRFVITEAPQIDICPHGRTYPKKAVFIAIKNKMTPTDQGAAK